MEKGGKAECLEISVLNVGGYNNVSVMLQCPDLYLM